MQCFQSDLSSLSEGRPDRDVFAFRPVSPCVFFRKSVQLINPFLNADYGGFRRAADGYSPD